MNDPIAKDLHAALVATWIIIESDPEFLDHIGQCTSKATGKTLHETARDAIARYDARQKEQN